MRSKLGVRIGGMVGGAAAALILVCVATEVNAQGRCARPQDLAALKTAGLQQKLMVAALSCDAGPRYNQFVTTYQKELFAADRALQAFFRRLNPRTGSADYNAYKTRLANSSSITSIGDMRAFCEGTKAMYANALDFGKKALAVFVSTEAEAGDPGYPACAGPAPTGPIEFAAAEPPENVPLPQGKPAVLIAWRPPLVFVDGSIPAVGLRRSTN